uniref:HTH cro/C1-type domain-containing protein n=1 Tax=Astyanax mexicanus TaxID=7994 RepID=A0A3B1IIV2_ASTMX
MGKQRDLSTGIVAQIQALRQQDLTQTKTAEQLGISQSSVCKALKKNCSKRTNCSGVRKTSARDNKQLRKIAINYYRRLRELGFKSCVPAVKPMLNKKQMEKRLKRAKEHGEWTAEDCDFPSLFSTKDEPALRAEVERAAAER